MASQGLWKREILFEKNDSTISYFLLYYFPLQKTNVHIHV